MTPLVSRPSRLTGPDETTPSSRWGWRLIERPGVWSALVALLTLPAAWPLLQPGFIATRAGGDSPFLLIRLHQLLAGLALGFPVRWMPDAAHGLGYPFWNFYAPLPYYLAALFSGLGLGVIAPIKLAQLLGFLVAAWGMDALAREVWDSRPAGLLAAVAYTHAPFHLVNVYVRGDSLGEFWAFAFYPLTWLATRRLLRRPSAAALVGLALAYAGLVLSHNISALIFSPFLILFAVLVTYSVLRSSSPASRSGLPPSVLRPPSSVLRLAYVALGLLLGLALSAWFWYPALAERGLVQLDVNLSGFFSYTGHFRGLNLVQTAPLFDYDPANGAAFVLGLAQAVGAVLGLLAVWAGRRGEWGTRWTLTLTLFVAVFCITPLSRPLWDTLPLLPFAQFPWRFLSVASFAGALLTGGIVAPSSSQLRSSPLPMGEGQGEGLTGQTNDAGPSPHAPCPPPGGSPSGGGGWPSQEVGKHYLIALAVGLALAVAGLARLTLTRIPIADSEITTERIALYEVFTGNIGTTIRGEYLPQAVQPQPQISTAWLTPDGQPTVVTLQGEASSIHRLAADRWQVDVASPAAQVAFPRLAYPGWRAWIDGQPTSSGVAPGLGYLTVPLVAGRHEVSFTFEHTRPRLGAELVSLVALLAVVGLWVVGGGWRVGKGWWVVGAWLVGLWVVGLALRPSPLPKTDLLTTNLDFVRIPWLHEAPQGIAYSQGARLAGYRLMGVATDGNDGVSAEVGGTLTVTLEWSSVAAGQADVVLVSPAEHRFGVSYQIANERVRLAPQTIHHLEVPPDTTPGLYWLRVRVQDGQGEEAWPLDDDGQTRGRLYLLPVQIRAAHSPPTTHPSSQVRRLTETVSLLDVGWQQRSRSQLFVNMTWLTTQPLTDNYVTSLRVVDAAGQVVASEDQPPGYGFFPAIAWTPGQPVYDRRRLTLPDGLPGGVYGLDIVLYQRATLTELGRVHLDGVMLEAVPR
ncbi:MAG: hypothetical protein KIT87_17365 [Anaerolineae bacterium]|nr:hypothetical protein [Anaerolineae bacterium]